MKTTCRKPRSDTKLGKLPLEDQARIAEWAARETIASVVQRCATELSQPVQVSPATISRWLQQWRLRQLTEERKVNLKEIFLHADANAQAIAEMLRETGASEDQIARASQLVFTMQASATKNTDLFIDLEKLRLAREAADHRARMDEARIGQKQAELALAQRRVTLLETKLRSIQKASENQKLTPAQRARRIAEIYGRA